MIVLIGKTIKAEGSFCSFCRYKNSLYYDNPLTYRCDLFGEKLDVNIINDFWSFFRCDSCIEAEQNYHIWKSAINIFKEGKKWQNMTQ